MIDRKFTTMFLLGQYGSGKDTHGPFIAEKFDLQHLSFSSFLAIRDTRARHYVEIGELVPDPDVFRILDSYPFTGYLFNGFPRTLEQLHFVLRKCQIDSIAMIYFDVADDVVIHRMKHRVVCSICKTATSLLKGHTLGGPCKIEGCPGVLRKRPDDSPEGIVKRMGIFREKTIPILKEAEKYGMTIYRIKVENEQPIEMTQTMIVKVLEQTVHVG